MSARYYAFHAEGSLRTFALTPARTVPFLAQARPYRTPNDLRRLDIPGLTAADIAALAGSNISGRARQAGRPALQQNR